MSNSHTPGPWTYLSGTSTCEKIIGADGKVVADGWYCRDAAEVDANSRLIAAAPELLDALQEASRIDDLHRLMNRIEGRRAKGSSGIAVDDDADAIAWREAVDNAAKLISKRNYVIAKATGATHD